MLRPVMFPPGRARLETSPALTGSPTAANTMGIALVAFRAARTPGLVAVTITSTLSFTSSVAISESRSCFPSAYRSQSICFSPQCSRGLGVLAGMNRDRLVRWAKQRNQELGSRSVESSPPAAPRQTSTSQKSMALSIRLATDHRLTSFI